VRHAARAVAAAGLFLLAAASAPVAAQPAAKKVLTFADENAWRTASSPVLSPDGAHIAYAVWPADGDGESVVRSVATGKEYRFPRGPGRPGGEPKGPTDLKRAPGTEPVFSPDGKRVLIPLTPTRAEVDKARAEKAVPQSTLAVVDLATGAADRCPHFGAFAVGGDGPGFVVYRKPGRGEPNQPEADDGKAPQPPPTTPTRGKSPFPVRGSTPPAAGAAPAGPTYGTDLVIRDLATKAERVLAEVSEFSLTRDGKQLVYAVASRTDDRNGVFAVDPRSMSAGGVVKAGAGRYSGLTWDEKQTKLAFLYDDSRVRPPNEAPPPRPAGAPAGTVAPAATPAAPPRYRAFVWDREAKPAEPAVRLPVGGTGGFFAVVPALLFGPPAVAPADEVLGPATPGQRSGWAFAGGSLAFSADGSMLFVNTGPKREPAPPAGPPNPADFQLDLWHWKDERLQPAQKLQAEADRAKTYSAVVNLKDGQFRQLSDDTATVGRPPSGSDWAVGSDDRKYRLTTGYGQPQSDYAAVNVRTGERKPLLTGYGGYTAPNPNLSPTGGHLLGFDGKDWFTVALADGKRASLTKKLKEKFFDEEDDHPGNPRPAGQPLWTADGKYVLVSDRYDLWKLAADGSSAENLTKVGRGSGVRFTLLTVRAADEVAPFRGVDLSKPQLLGAENLRTRDTGYYRLEPGAAEAKLLIMGPRRYGQPTRAKNADVYLLTVQTFADHPDYYVTTPDFHELKRVTDINPRVKEYNWGRAELVHYTSADGAKLSGVLVKPENFDPSKKYPMVVYIYERLSDTLHNFRLPVVTRGQVINPTFYASNGYLVLMPDIAYKVGAPGQSAIKCVLPAIQAVVDKGYVDEGAIGINGQSWGGYQIAYMVTQTDRFKAAVAGAPVSNMVSAYDGIRWGSGLTRQFQYEWTQSRIGDTLWGAPMRFVENSPVFMADRVKTPLLMIHNDQDDAVPWYQGIEYYLALRRLGRECYLLNYNGQPHNLTSRAAARDFAARMFQFFEHHLKAKAAPAWMEKGVPYLDREKDKAEVRKLLGPEKK
jgi:dipeptidyl aminopeptidase/acylaminoacyl peptidase